MVGGICCENFVSSVQNTNLSVMAYSTVWDRLRGKGFIKVNTAVLNIVNCLPWKHTNLAVKASISKNLPTKKRLMFRISPYILNRNRNVENLRSVNAELRNR